MLFAPFPHPKVQSANIPLLRSDFAAWQGLQAGKRAALTNEDQNILNRFQMDRSNSQDDLFYK